MTAISSDIDEDVLNVNEVASLLKLGKDAVYSGCARGVIPHRRIGKHLRFSRAAIMRWLDSCGPASASKGQ